MKKEDKDGVNFVFKQNPELKNIGTKEQYEEYLKTIFPGRKVQNMVYHQTPKKFDEFNIDKSRTGGIYFSPFNNRGLIFKDNTKVALLNIKNPFIITKKQNKQFEQYLPDLSKLSKKVDLKEYDGVIGFSNVFYDKGQLDSDFFNINASWKNNIEFVAFKPEQIYLLGSKKDIEDFKNFVQNKNSKNSLENKIISGLFILTFLTGITLAAFNLTGNIIGTSGTAHKLMGIVLFLLGISGFFAYRKLRS
jgi:hypothetical protein